MRQKRCHLDHHHTNQTPEKTVTSSLVTQADGSLSFISIVCDSIFIHFFLFLEVCDSNAVIFEQIFFTVAVLLPPKSAFWLKEHRDVVF